MILGVPRGHFYYDYKGFIDDLFKNTGIEVTAGRENDEEILKRGSEATVDEACVPIKLLVGQIDMLTESCDMVLVPRVMKDFNGRWLCPKLLGLPELAVSLKYRNKLIVTDPLYFNDRRKTMHSFKKVFQKLGLKNSIFKESFVEAFRNQENIVKCTGNYHIESAWEFTPEIPGEGEIILPNTKKVFLTGHSYNVYDRFFNGNLMEKLDDLGIGTITERCVKPGAREASVAEAGLMKEPFWEAFVKIFGSAMQLKNDVDGIIYLSSFSCGTDAFITEMLKIYITDKPILILKLDEHKATAGYDTRLEAFADLLERRKVS